MLEITRGKLALWAANRAAANEIIGDQGIDLNNCKEAVRWVKGILAESDTAITVLSAENVKLDGELKVWKDKAKRRGRTIGYLAGAVAVIVGVGVVKEAVE